MATATDEAGLTVAYARPCDALHRLGTDTLDHAERALAAARFSKRIRHDHFIAGRALLRNRLSAAVADTVRPAAWQLVIGACGKPSPRQRDWDVAWTSMA